MNTSDIYERVEEPINAPVLKSAALVKAVKRDSKKFVDRGEDPIRFEEFFQESKGQCLTSRPFGSDFGWKF